MNNTTSPFPITIFSFGYKYGPPQDVNFLFDVRFLANPFHDQELRSFNGLEESISRYVLDNESGQECLKQLFHLATFHTRQLQKSNKDALRIAIGCTGGHHRSVAVTEALAKLLAQEFKGVEHFHRDIKKESH